MARTYNVDVESLTTIRQLKQILEKTYGVKNAQTLTLGFNQEQFADDDLTLADYDIPDGSILELVDLSINSRSGFAFTGTKFANVSNKEGLKRMTWATSAPRWRTTIHGLCLEGLCANKQCEAYQKQVIIPIGFRIFDILVDPSEMPTVCPICKNYVDPQTCSFNNCWWKYEGIKQDEIGKPAKKCSSNWQYADNAYHYFDQEISGTVVWKRLIVEAVQNKPST